jgi:signal transduction histidine kinase/ActR/RegA family two-component response regulator
MRSPDASTAPRDPFSLGWEDPAMLDREVARRTVRSGSLLVAAAAAIFGVIYWIGGSPALAIPTFLASAALTAIGAVRFRDARRQLAAAVSVGLVLLASQVLLLGDVNTGVTVWFLVPNLAAMLLGAKWIAAGGALVTTSVVTLVVAAERLGWPITGDEAMPSSDLVMAVSIVGSLVVVGVIARISLGARRRLMAEVEVQNAELAKALEEAETSRGIAIEASAAKDRFFANLTHEIRTPLNGIAGTTELLRHTDLDAGQRSLTDALAASSGNLVALVNAMLDHARLRAGHVGVDLGPVDVRMAARDLRDLFGAQAAGKGLDLVITVADDVPPWIETDGIRLRQVMGNLVGNAIKFTQRGSVTVTGSMAQPDDGHPDPRFVVVVADTGPGVSPELARAIFEPFVQGDATISRTHGGTGLGLSIAKGIAELLGGTLAVSSTPGEGAAFTVSIPVRVVEPPAREPGHPQDAPTHAAAGTRVLLAEDNAINRAVASRMLERLAAVVEMAEDGAAAVRLAADHAFDLVLMDLQMPGVDGIEAARRIRAQEAATGGNRVRIVAMTGNDPADYADACERAGMDGFLMKPVALAELRAVLAGAIPA